MSEYRLITQKPDEPIGEVDVVKVTVLMDNMVPFGAPYTAEHGYSLYVQVFREDHTLRLLLDAGSTSANFSANLLRAEVPLQSLDLVYLSHCHHDHTGGLEWLLENREGPTPIVGHPQIFRKTFKLDWQLKNIGISVSQNRITELGGSLFLIKNAVELFPGIVSSGEIERTTDFEAKETGRYTFDESGNLVSDWMQDDMALIINIRDKGLLVLGGCCHAGIVNTLRHAVKLTGVQRVHGIVGGLHLATAGEELVDQTIEAIRGYAPSHIHAGHCTGFQALKKISGIPEVESDPLGVGMQLQF
ncbi:MAG: MBL fold metallo-hydrolase [Bacillota bacterium]|nr:MBL fold metallo-hydrolase [Bacillota bacterium]MDW7678265.1 MBL fold metallo-hydrolase [Bacillota bacterium]